MQIELFFIQFEGSIGSALTIDIIRLGARSSQVKALKEKQKNRYYLPKAPKGVGMYFIIEEKLTVNHVSKESFVIL